ncbi:response regulator transcription factor [Burkholderia ubonensis]|uniref:response regulator transcription factor n=1 Tax=Burkholderia ubonensis TaxID=101571 RepID=UPI000AF4F4C6|nr:response regulator transcription factor [Burkholderia ubonensis]
MSSIFDMRLGFADMRRSDDARSNRSRVAILDANIERAATVEQCLSGAEFTCRRYVSSVALIDDQNRQQCDVIVLGEEIAGESCVEALSRIRNDNLTHRMPVLMLAGAMNQQLVAMIESGADTFETWPFRPNVLVARVYALLRRVYMNRSNRLQEIFGEYTFDVRSHRVWRHGRLIELTHKEFMLALFMFQHQTSVVTVKMLSESVWGRVVPDDACKRTVAVHISRIRQKLDLSGNQGFRLSFVSNCGYRLLKCNELD